MAKKSDPQPAFRVTKDEAQAIAEGRHGDPFSVLGPHDGKLAVWAPGAATLALKQGRGKPVALVQHPECPGLFEGTVDPGKPYTLEAEDIHGTGWSFADPYRFGPVLGELDEYLLGEGGHRRLWEALGAHPMTIDKVDGTHFAVWAPNAERVSVVGDFNAWNGTAHPMRKRGATGVWEIFVPGIGEGTTYKYEIRALGGAILPLKADPVGFGSEHPPATGSVVRHPGLGRAWDDSGWMNERAARNSVDAPISIYEVHLGSWRRVDNGARPLSYHELATELVDYVKWMGFTHIELMPISEHPFDGSWGYQPIGMFAPTIRHGTPQEFAAFVEAAHNAGLGVLIDWVPGHFPTDEHGLGRFDGTALYEHGDPKEGFHSDWSTLIYNYGRTEVANYLEANALYWLEEYHLDGLRVDAVASMLYRDYSRKDGEWIPNKDGGRENYEAIDLLRKTNTLAYGEHPGIMTVAEESTAFGGVSRPVEYGGLGFGFKWNMGWMNDSLEYISKEPLFRKFHHGELTFSMVYAWSENFILPISHDEVVHGKGSMIAKMPGTAWEQFANLRAFYGYMWTHPGKKLLFMGQEFAQGREWNYAQSLDWNQTDLPEHRGMQLLVRDLNAMYRDNPALHVNDTRPEGFAWLEANDADNSVLVFARKGREGDPMIVVAANLTPLERPVYRIGFPAAGRWDEILNTDAGLYGGGNRGNLGGIETEPVAWHNQPQSAYVVLPPLSVVVFRQT
ncbi:1,4-alpha-glucan branching protein GlgB [Maritimibacter sp. HL-12]|jgi:1,4-alpha-glucan branching enzyme|uniref:1,4-alpha-glucan branching protein GlgB n=1 Tax=Maritimibacter sp. HL-12 TaxID=1162418 RepID=UPI000A0F3F94|nr:1,4-alpha-glucan branching protein GlgB [Maritimibacter sp. HL-12]SMH42120.1 1,4-alpha-glucan branching enzyme [Maritimibacter sp. HL-12]